MRRRIADVLVCFKRPSSGPVTAECGFRGGGGRGSRGIANLPNQRDESPLSQANRWCSGSNQTDGTLAPAVRRRPSTTSVGFLRLIFTTS